MLRRANALASLPLLTALAFTAAVPARADGDPGPQSSGDITTSQAGKDGCTRDPGNLIDGLAPSWVYVYDRHVGPTPPIQHMIGTIGTAEPHGLGVHPAGDDLPSGHDDYDLNVNIFPDGPYRKFIGGHLDANPARSTGNFAGSGESTGAVHSEMEGSAIPISLWPEQGDRIDLLGHWAWDCGHWGVPTAIFSPDYTLPKVGQPCLGTLADIPQVFVPAECSITGEDTEFHPWKAMWDVHAQSIGPEAEAEGLLWVSTNLTRAGLVEQCAHQFQGTAHLPNLQMRTCALTQPLWQDVTGDYSYYLAAPPRPSPHAHLTYRVVDVGSTGASAPTLTPEGDGVRVKLHLTSAMAQTVHAFYRVYAGWDQLEPAAVPTHLRVSLDRLEIHRAMDPGCTPLGSAGGLGPPGCTGESQSVNQASSAPGEWNLFYNIAGAWGRYLGGEFDVNDGDVRTPNQAVDIYVAPGRGWRFVTLGRECDLQGLALATGPSQSLSSCPGLTALGGLELSDTNDSPGSVRDTWASAQASVGTHVRDAGTSKTHDSSTCPPDANPKGCYTVTYSVKVIDDAASRVLVAARAGGLPDTGLPAPFAEVALLLGLAALLATRLRAPRS